MSDDLHPIFESLDRLPVPEPSVSEVQRRGVRIRRTRFAVGALASVVIVLAGFLMIQSVRGSSDPPPPAPIGEPSPEPPAVDVVAQDVRKDLGRVCGTFDFYFKSEIASGDYRPVQCGSSQSLNIVERGPVVVIHAFSGPKQKGAWLEEHPAPWHGRLAGDRWVVDVMQPDRFEQVQQELEDAEVLSEPTSTWVPARGHKIEAVDPGFIPRVDLPSASREVKAREEGEVLGTQLGVYSDASNKGPVPAWIITVRRCVPQYGGQHASPDCIGDQLYVVVDATTGNRVASFTN